MRSVHKDRRRHRVFVVASAMQVWASFLVDRRLRSLWFVQREDKGCSLCSCRLVLLGDGCWYFRDLATSLRFLGLGRLEQIGHHVCIFCRKISQTHSHRDLQELEGLVLLGPQTAQRKCILFAAPQDGHLTSSVTSFKAFPAICLCLLLECETFFLGTAFSRPSHISSSDGSDGRFNEMAGIGQEIFGRRGCDRCRM